MANRVSLKSTKVTRSTQSGRFVKSPAKSGSVKTAQVDRAIKKVAKRRNENSAKNASSRSAQVKA